MKNKILISLPIVVIIATLVIFLQDKTFANYKKGINVNINDTTGKMICDAQLDNPGTYVSADGWAYFKVIVKNYDSNNNITDVPIEYNLDITNATGSSAQYRYKTGAESASAFATSLTTSNYEFTTGTKQTREFIIEVKNESASSADVDFKADLNCYQTSNS